MQRKAKDEKVNIGIAIPRRELNEMRRVSCIDRNGTAVLAMARKGLAAEKEQDKAKR